MFSSPKNKEMIWELLKEQSKFPLTQQWRRFFELTFENVKKRQRTYPNLVAMNKHLISICIEEMDKFIINVPKTILKPKGTIQHSFKQKQEDIKKRWFLIDAEKAVLGRLAVISANILRGKNKAEYTPNQDCGDNLIIINSDKIYLSGKKKY